MDRIPQSTIWYFRYLNESWMILASKQPWLSPEQIQRQLWDQWNGNVSDSAKFDTEAHNGNDLDPKDDEAKLHSSARNFTEIPKPAESKQPVPSTPIQSFQPPNTSTPCHRSISHTGPPGGLPMEVRNTDNWASPEVARSPTQGLVDKDPGLLVLLERLTPVLVRDGPKTKEEAAMMVKGKWLEMGLEEKELWRDIARSEFVGQKGEIGVKEEESHNTPVKEAKLQPSADKIFVPKTTKASPVSSPSGQLRNTNSKLKKKRPRTSKIDVSNDSKKPIETTESVSVTNANDNENTMGLRYLMSSLVPKLLEGGIKDQEAAHAMVVKKWAEMGQEDKDNLIRLAKSERENTCVQNERETKGSPPQASHRIEKSSDMNCNTVEVNKEEKSSSIEDQRVGNAEKTNGSATAPITAPKEDESNAKEGKSDNPKRSTSKSANEGCKVKEKKEGGGGGRPTIRVASEKVLRAGGDAGCGEGSVPISQQSEMSKEPTHHEGLHKLGDDVDKRAKAQISEKGDVACENKIEEENDSKRGHKREREDDADSERGKKKEEQEPGLVFLLAHLTGDMMKRGGVTREECERSVRIKWDLMTDVEKEVWNGLVEKERNKNSINT